MLDPINRDVRFCSDCDQCIESTGEYNYCVYKDMEVMFYQRACGTFYPSQKKAIAAVRHMIAEARQELEKFNEETWYPGHEAEEEEDEA